MTVATLDATIQQVLLETASTGGSTASPTGFKVPESGYMVGGLTPSLIFGSDLLDGAAHREVAEERIFNWLRKHPAMIMNPNIYLGGWIDNFYGMVYIDLSEWMQHKDAAIDRARTLGEIAIWDLAEGKEIRV